ncbi:hypothetical protein D9757_010254 [Collybiopsis confluens]|uniref:Uncharacterized protein n=1 Tax=Collybiopsis confluens TaxID=2823264 RepID=A0A8H5M3I2_9AGAR|nr:hypothetical protein D9757_010254 [Collybiopsis confluens]
MYSLKPVLKHLLSDWDQNSRLNVLLRNTTAKNISGTPTRSDEGAPELDGSLAGENAEHLEESKEIAASRLFRTLERLMAWHSAVTYIWRRAPTLLSGKDLQVMQYSYDSPVVQEITSDHILAVLRGVRAGRVWTDDDVESIRKKIPLASIHAEAALMSWATFSIEARDLISTSDTLIVGTSNKCCRLCWLLQETLNSDRSSLVTILLSGVHTMFFPWIPPPGIPHHILLQLREELLQSARLSEIDYIVDCEGSDDDGAWPFDFSTLAEVLN